MSANTDSSTNTHKLPLTVTNRELKTRLTNDKKSEREDSVVSLYTAKSLVEGSWSSRLYI
ncbi:hypothetical protein IMY05_001G0208800 [Salix suchowensis]|nr:hypothetical protein IMY05_001G0208800 [Salix suchowensis]